MTLFLLLLDDARLHSQPTYVHCKAGKSRSVTAVMAYLIHANHWTLAQTYAFVLDRRKGISPNIGFVSELMNFEEEELGGKSLGVVSSGGNSNNNNNNPSGTTPPGNRGDVASSSSSNKLSDGMASGAIDGSSNHGTSSSSSNERERPGHGYSQSVVVGGSNVAGMLPPGRRGMHHGRESLPPAFAHQPASTSNLYSSSGFGGGGDAEDGGGGDGGGGFSNTNGPEVGDTMAYAQEVEVKDAEGRYRHARRAPVDELTLQPMRRSSKAGLESSSWSMSMASSK